LVVDGVLPDRVTVGWRAARGEGFPTPYGDELVMFEDYFIPDLAFRSIRSSMDLLSITPLVFAIWA